MTMETKNFRVIEDCVSTGILNELENFGNIFTPLDLFGKYDDEALDIIEAMNGEKLIFNSEQWVDILKDSNDRLYAIYADGDMTSGGEYIMIKIGKTNC